MTTERGKVGAFWVLPGSLVIGEAVILGEAEHDDGFINGPSSHNDLWSNLAKPSFLIGQAYTTVSRGRVIYENLNRRYVIFAAPEVLGSADSKRSIETFYDLDPNEVRISWRGDPHYVTQRDLIYENGDFP